LWYKEETMSDFSVSILPVSGIVPIENADNIEAVLIGDYKSIVKKGDFTVGDRIAYIPEGALVPIPLLEEMGLIGKLSGKQKNRVKAIKLRGCLSQGLVLSYGDVLKKYATNPVKRILALWRLRLGADVSDILGIIKYEPILPSRFSGVLKPHPYTLNYDIENIKKYNRVIEDGEEVSMTEKLHGTLIQIGIMPDQSIYVTSKGLGKAGIIIEDNEANAGNTYICAFKKWIGANTMCNLQSNVAPGEQVTLFAEVFGIGIQDLGYAQTVNQCRAFDIHVGKKGQGYYMNVEPFRAICAALAILVVPEVYRGKFSKAALDAATNGLETVSGNAAHLREGVVVRPLVERETRGLGRVILKSVSEAYLLRKGEVTEYA
jgi:RNA ligase (TIGR02306 family)